MNNKINVLRHNIIHAKNRIKTIKEIIKKIDPTKTDRRIELIFVKYTSITLSEKMITSILTKIECILVIELKDLQNEYANKIKILENKIK